MRSPARGDVRALGRRLAERRGLFAQSCQGEITLQAPRGRHQFISFYAYKNKIWQQECVILVRAVPVAAVPRVSAGGGLLGSCGRTVFLGVISSFILARRSRGGENSFKMDVSRVSMVVFCCEFKVEFPSSWW